jgi:hypothetical protein
MFVPDAVVGALALWFLRGRRRPDPAIKLFVVWDVLNYGFFAFHAEGYLVFATTTFVLLPPLFGFYLGGRRLRLWLSGVLLVRALISLVVHALGVGHRVVATPSTTQSGAQVLFAIGTL